MNRKTNTLKRVFLAFVATLAAMPCMAQEVNIYGGGNWADRSTMTGTNLEVAYTQTIIPHLSITGRLESASSHTISIEDQFGNFANMEYFCSAQVGPKTNWVIGKKLDLSLALLAGVEYYVAGYKESGCFRGSYSGVDGTAFVTYKGTRFRWDALIAASWWITDKVSVGVFFDQQMPYVDYPHHAGLTVGFRL